MIYCSLNPYTKRTGHHNPEVEAQNDTYCSMAENIVVVTIMVLAVVAAVVTVSATLTNNIALLCQAALKT